MRVASAGALASIGDGVAKSRTGGGTLRDAATALIRRLKDPETTVRVEVIKALGSIAPGWNPDRAGRPSATRRRP